MTNAVYHRSDKQDWRTPRALYAALDAEFHFGLDAATSADNPLGAPAFFTPETDGLLQDWTGYGACFCNPPYSDSARWIAKAAAESQKGATVVMLLAARPDTRVWHTYIHGKAEVRWIKGRLRFEGASNSAPFPSAIVVMRPAWKG